MRSGGGGTEKGAVVEVAESGKSGESDAADVAKPPSSWPTRPASALYESNESGCPGSKTKCSLGMDENS